MNRIKRVISSWQKYLRKFETFGLSEKQFEVVKNKLQPVLSGIFGYNALLYSSRAKDMVFAHLSILNSTVISRHQEQSDLICLYEELPIASDCVDLVVLPEILQYSHNPHQILREVERVLIPEGHIILLLPNPISGQCINNWLIALLTNNKTKTKSIGRLRLNDWFRLLGLEVTAEIPICISEEKLKQENSNAWTNKIFQLGYEYFAGYYIIIAKKKVSTMTPIRPSWRRNKKLVNPRLTEPTVRTDVENCVKQIMR